MKIYAKKIGKGTRRNPVCGICGETNALKFSERRYSICIPCFVTACKGATLRDFCVECGQVSRFFEVDDQMCAGCKSVLDKEVQDSTRSKESYKIIEDTKTCPQCGMHKLKDAFKIMVCDMLVEKALCKDCMRENSITYFKGCMRENSKELFKD